MHEDVFLLYVFFSVTVISQAATGALNCSSDEANDFLKVPELVSFVSVLYEKTERTNKVFVFLSYDAGKKVLLE